MDHRQVLGQEIVRLRTKLGSVLRPLSQAGLAEILTRRLKRQPPIAGSTIKKWEKGRGGMPDPWALIELARLGETTAEQLVYPDHAATTTHIAEQAAELQFAEPQTPPIVGQAVGGSPEPTIVTPIAAARGGRGKSRASGAKAKHGHRRP